jgi:hypothetical protein
MAALPSERKLSPEELAAWWTPLEACVDATKCVVGAEAASKALWQLLLAGMIEAVATSASMTPESRSPITTNDPSFIARGHWRFLSDMGSDLWNGAYARFWLVKGYRDQPATYQAFGIKLNPADVRANLPPPTLKPSAESSAEPGPSAPSPANTGGRPRKDFWDDMWIEVCAHTHEQGIPEKQVDIENAMLSWAAENGHNLSVSSVRPRARKLLNRLRNPRTKT